MSYFSLNQKIGLTKSLLLLLLSFSFTMFASQPPDTLWTKTFGGSNIDVGYFVQQTNDGGFIIAGYTRSFGTMSGRNVWLIKTDMFGNMLWNKTFGGNNDEEAYSVRQTIDGGFILAGYTKSFGFGSNDFYIIKTDSNGNEQWVKFFGGAQDEEAYDIIQTSDGNYVAAGATSSFGAGGRDVWLIKINTSGNEIWRRTLGGLSSDGARSIQQSTDGGFIITGWTFSQGPGFVGNALLLKTDSLGNQLWSKAFGGSDVDRGLSVQQTSDGGYIFTGYTASSGAGLDDLYLVKTDVAGNEVWSKTFGGSGRDYGNSVQQTLDGGYIIAGYTLSFGAGSEDVWLVKTDSNGNQEWSKTYGGSVSDVGYCVRETSDGGFIITGHTLSYGAGVHDLWLIRTATIIPVELISFSADYSNSSIKLTWITASEVNNKGFEVERRLTQTLSKGEDLNDWTLIGFVEGNGTTTKTSFYSFEDGNLSAGKYSYRLKQIDFDGTHKYYYLSEVVEINTPDKIELYQNYPNPFNPSTKISFTISNVGTGLALSVLKVYDVLGNEVATLVNEELTSGQYEVEFDLTKINNQKRFELTSGVYFFQLKVGDYRVSRKMLFLK